MTVCEAVYNEGNSAQSHCARATSWLLIDDCDDVRHSVTMDTVYWGRNIIHVSVCRVLYVAFVELLFDFVVCATIG